MKDFICTDYEVRFSNEAENLFLLTNYGNLGWRLRSANANGCFEEKGAAQALACFMGEKPQGEAQRLTVVEAADSVTVTACDGTQARLTVGERFGIAFMASDGTVMSEVSEIVCDGNTVQMKGSLTERECVYGGGQRFDAVNRRGTSMVLYSYDGYNTDNGKATYMPIPLFMTSRGGGIYVNRFERMNVDFGEAAENVWAVDLKHDVLDCYFYATGSFADILSAYTVLTGPAVHEPSDWMQGYLICRYGPDNHSFDKDIPIYESIMEIPEREKLYLTDTNDYLVTDLSKRALDHADEIVEGSRIINERGRQAYTYRGGKFIRTTQKGAPAGRSVKTTLERLMAVGQKPTGVIMEGWGWQHLSADSALGRAKREEFSRMMAWLKEQNIRAMLYMAIGALDPAMKGYKPEYQVWVDITDKEGNVTSTCRVPKQGFTSNPDVNLNSSQNYLDITNPEAVDWYMNVIWEQLISAGIDGVKIDFCETMPDEGTYCTYDKEGNIANRFSIQYKFHNPEVFGKGDVHHAYASYFISLFCKKMSEKVAARADGDGFMVLSRGGGIGSQRNPYLWAGDQVRYFKTLKPQLLSVLTASMSGVPFMTYDMSGYGYQYRGGYFDPELEAMESRIFARGVEYTAFTACLQTHGDVRNLYELTEDAQKISSLYETIHTAILPYTRKYFTQASRSGMPVVRPLVLNYPKDEAVYTIEDQFMLGEGLLVAPILEDETFVRDVYLPAGRWTNLLTGECVTGGKTVSVHANIAQIPLFLNHDAPDAKELAAVFAGEAWTSIKEWN
ncbi:MAG: glycoside hydrolase family 31 protein [Clostridia bacterium]|nr:glycoside hydrolase family 31 protein [Clostridia bacterium]